VRPGVSHPSYDGTSFALATGAAAGAYPVSNLASKLSLRTVFQQSGTGAIAITFALATLRQVQFLGVLHHNASQDATFRWRLFSAGAADPVTNAAHLVYDSGVLPFFPEGVTQDATYPAVTPHVAPEERALLTGRLDLAGNTAPWQIGALEFGGWWDWPAISVPRELGVDNADTVVQQVGGADHVMGQWASRTVKGTRADVDITAERATFMDFQMQKGLRTPFVWLWDYDDPTTWARECLVVRNATLPALIANRHPLADLSFDLIEHMR
jgi:hypothetical protein